MKILLISHSNSFGGAELCFLEMLKALSDKSKYELYCVFPLHEGALEEACLPYCKQTYSYYLPRWIDDGKRLSTIEKTRRSRSILSSTIKAKKLLKQIKPDLVITNTSVIPQFAVASKLLKIRHLWFVHELVDEDFGCQFLFGKKLSKQLIALLSQHVVVNSLFVKSRYESVVQPEKLVMIYQPVDLAVTKIKIHSNTELLNLLIIGKVSEPKGQMEAVRACEILYNKGVKFHLSVVGIPDNDYISKIKSSVSSEILQHIDFVSFTNQPEIYYEQADIVMVCSRCEALGRVTIEAMKAGLPVVASDRGGNLELVKDGKTGYLYKYGDPEDLADKIILLQDVKLRSLMGKNGKNFTESRFNSKLFSSLFCKVIDY